MFCCDCCHARATNNDVMNGILGYKNSACWLIGYSSDYKETYNFCSEKCLKEAEIEENGKVL